MCVCLLPRPQTKPITFCQTENSLFGSGNESGSEASKQNGTPTLKTGAASKQVPAKAVGGGGLFDDEEDEDDFFSGKNLKKSDSGKF